MAIFQMHVGVQDMSFGVTFFHVTRLANCESEKAWAPEEGLDREDLKRTTVTPHEGWRTVRGSSFRDFCCLIFGPVARGDGVEESERTERIGESYSYTIFEEPVGVEDSGGMERNGESYNYGPRVSLRVCVRQALYSMKKKVRSVFVIP